MLLLLESVLWLLFIVIFIHQILPKLLSFTSFLESSINCIHGKLAKYLSKLYTNVRQPNQPTPVKYSIQSKNDTLKLRMANIHLKY
jgi:hypothetical protein